MAISNHNEIVALGRDPIRPDSPVGDPCRYDEAFERLAAQLDRLGSLTGEEVEWRVVVELATDLLKSKSKDLLVMTYLTLGLFELQSYAGLAAGLEAYIQFIQNFWEKCYPKVKPAQGRYNALQYLADRVFPLVELKGGQCKKPPGAGDKEAVHQCAELIEKLDQVVTPAFAPLGETPNLLPLVRSLRALKEKVGPLTAGPAEAVAGQPQAADQAAGAAAPAAPSPAGAGVPEVFATAAQAAEAVLRVAKYLLTQDNKDPRGYRLSRAVHFGGLVSSPKDALLPPIPAPRRQFFEKLAADGNWPELLTQAEGQFVVTPLWLDLQRYVGSALKNLGPAYGAAHHAVVMEAAALNARLPELLDLTFRDRTAFADGGTKAWVAEAAAEFGGGQRGGRAAGPQDDVGSAAAAARKLLSESKPAEAVGRMSDAVDASAGGRQRFRAQLALARLLMDMNRLTLAAPLLDRLEQDIDELQLERWEPELAAEMLQSQYECFRKLRPKPTPEEAQRGMQIFGRLCRVDPRTALQLDSAAAKG